MDSRTKYVIKHSGPMGSKTQQNTAAAYYARKNVPTSGIPAGKMDVNHVSNFAGIMAKCPPPAPSQLLKKLNEEQSGQQNATSSGKVRVILRVANSGVLDPEKPANFRLDQKKRQVTLIDPTHTKEDSKVNVAAPKMFAFDGLFTDEDAQSEVAASALSEAIHGVISGVDSCLFAFGHASLGKTYSMIGSDESSKTLGVIPQSIAWLFRSIKEKKEGKSTRFAVRVSALEIGGANEDVRDLLAGQAASESDNDAPPSQFFPVTQTTGITGNLTQLRCSNAERAGYYLDAALTARSTNMAADLSGRDSHFVFSLHLYQYSVENPKKGLIGGRSRLHLIDFGCCERTKTSSGSITLSGLGNVILGIFNGQRHLPFKESKVTQMLKECMGSYTCQATMLAHVTPEPSHYSETLHTTQLASRIHRMRRKKAAKTGCNSNGSAGSGSSDDLKMNRLVKLASSSSEFTDPSSSEQSCDTVIFVGSRDDEGTDLEHPPVFLPGLNSGDNRGQMAKVLRGTSAEFKSSSLERQHKQRRSSKSPSSSQNGLRICSPVHMPQPNKLRPGSVGSTPTHSWKMNRQQAHLRQGGGGSLPRNPKGKMPLTGKVAGYRQQPVSPQPQFINQYDPNTAIYGYMDDQKISMIQQWVECQANQRHAVHQQQHQKAMMQQKVEPEPFAWLKNQESESGENCKVLTQFKQVDSSDESDPALSDSSPIVLHHLADVHSHSRPKLMKSQPRKVSSADEGVCSGSEIHQKVCSTPPLSPCIIVPEDMETVNAVLPKPRIVTDIRKSIEQPETIIKESAAVEEKPLQLPSEAVKKEESNGENENVIRTIDELYTHCEQLVETLSQASEELKREQNDQTSSEENLNVTVPLDANKLHFVNPKAFLNEVKVCETPENFSQNFHQLAKLHELYQSVSSINDKAKQNLEEAKNREDVKSSCLSLSALMTDLERISIHSDANSLCSEPVKMPGTNQDINSNLDDLFDFCNNQTMSLGDLDQCGIKKEEQQERSDSPILEGIDQELAKYAKLKDLEKVYTLNPNPMQQMARHPDGSSNPDLNSTAVTDTASPMLTEQRRSPGNGRSGSEDEFEGRRMTSDGQSMSSGNSATTSKSSGCSSMSSSSNEHLKLRNRSSKRCVNSRDERTVLGQSQSTDTSSEIEVWQPQVSSSSSKTAIKSQPKFSRLFKLSRSPLKVIQESNRRSKSADTRKSKKSLFNKNSSASKLADNKKVSSSTSNLKASKNAKGTSSSFSILKSPYSVNTQPKFKTNTESTASSDSGLESGSTGIIKKIVKLRTGRGGGGANNSAIGVNSSKDRKSSGYESSINGSDSNTSEAQTVDVLSYDAQFVQRLDERWRTNEVARLQSKQSQLKQDLQSAKDRISASKWTFGLHVSESVSNGSVNSRDPSIIEALQKETEILGKRVDAAKSHAVLQTAFDVRPDSPLTQKLLESCCTTECDPAEVMILAASSSKETEIF